MKSKTFYARQLRKKSTPAERKLWQELRRLQIAGFRFRRQVPMGPYILDFLCYEARVVIEVDGSQHQENKEYDQQRTYWLEQQGYKVQRFWNNEVMQELDAVKEVILQFCQSSSPLPVLPPQGGKGRSL